MFSKRIFWKQYQSVMRHSVGPDLDPNCWQGSTADDDKNCSWQAKSYVHVHTHVRSRFFAVIVIYILHFGSNQISSFVTLNRRYE